ncbi:quaternary ammonium compound-resistance protein SugE [Pseudonocardia ammonioxydans]|uniref:Quaternary ammonium compound-resistance protein SugE n=1 Tax=Pseudonocardia ammonioxydans TaxID=260086 RepID=A0A1I5HHL9_PSUAM|nr:multidrug efflux SMR transporter [Pseudonocardia ammonioxydans]SFO47649.1 quaternary ammonium compound-resistance protein SugE [Pseudonocardia ammonioxydans]
MAWVFVILGGLFETAFAVSLKHSEGFTRLWPTVSFLVCAVISFALLMAGLRELPVGTAYAAWTGIGAAGTAIAGMIWFGDSAAFLRVASVVLIVAGVVGLNLVGSNAL